MNKLLHLHRPIQPRPAAEWPSRPEVDGFIWEVGPEPSGPTEAEVSWAAEELNENYHTGEPTPDEVLELQAGESLAMDRMEAGIRCL